MIRAKKSVEVYETLDSLVEAISGRASPNVKMNNVEKLFLYFGGCLALVSFAFVVDRFVVKQEITLKALRRWKIACGLERADKGRHLRPVEWRVARLASRMAKHPSLAFKRLLAGKRLS